MDNDNLTTLPSELLTHEIYPHFYEVDRQTLRKVCTFFHNTFPFKEINYETTDLDLFHIIKFKKHWRVFRSVYFICRLAMNNQVESLKYAHDNGYSFSSYQMSYAVGGQHLECIKFLHSVGCPWDEYCASEAATNGDLEVLKFLRNPPTGNPCPWDRDTIARAIMKGYIDILQYAHENGCPWGGYDNSHLYNNTYLCFSETAAYSPCIKYAIEHGYKIMLGRKKHN